MQTISKKDRLAIYWEIYSVIQAKIFPKAVGFCHVFKWHFGVDIYNQEDWYLFPELTRNWDVFKSYQYRSWTAREKVILNAIDELTK